DDQVAAAATLWALERWWSLGGGDLPAAAAPVIAAAAEYVARSAGNGQPDTDTDTDTDTGAGAGADAAAWRAAGMASAASLLGALGEPGAAADAARLAPAPADPPPPPGWPPAAGERPLEGLRPLDAATAARAALAAGREPLEAVDWLLEAAGPTWAWPTAVHPRLWTGTAGSGHDPAVTAAWWGLARAVLVGDDADLPGSAAGAPASAGTPVGAVTLLRWLPASWRGQPLEVDGMPSLAGAVSFALRWHGPRPALLWEVDADGPVTVRAPGLDPAWVGTGAAGEALLGPGPPRW
ncbi:MAG: hypothetical protein ACYCUG_04560, partial [Acidimicrobiales bacterium]